MGEGARVKKPKGSQTMQTDMISPEKLSGDEMKPLIAPVLPVSEVSMGTDFTGIARSMQCYLKQDSGYDFNLFRILTLHIVKGKVERVEYSDPFANFEAGVRMELANELGLLHLNHRWENGKTLER